MFEIKELNNEEIVSFYYDLLRGWHTLNSDAINLRDEFVLKARIDPSTDIITLLLNISADDQVFKYTDWLLILSNKLPYASCLARLIPYNEFTQEMKEALPDPMSHALDIRCVVLCPTADEETVCKLVQDYISEKHNL